MSSPDTIINCNSGGDIVFTLGAYPGTEIMRLKIVGGQGVIVTPAGGGSPLFEYQNAVTAADGSTSTFAFAAPIGSLVTAFIGGVAQLPSDCSVDASGQLVFGANVEPPQVPVTALFVRASA